MRRPYIYYTYEVIRRTVRKPTGSRLSGAGCPYMNGDCSDRVVENSRSNVDNVCDKHYRKMWIMLVPEAL